MTTEFAFGSYNLDNGGIDHGDDRRLRRQLALLAETGADAWALQECKGFTADGQRALFLAERILDMRAFLGPQRPRYTHLYHQAQATADTGLRREILHQMQQIDFIEGGYIIPAFTDTLDAYSDAITGYGPARLGRPLMDYGFHHLAFTRS